MSENLYSANIQGDFNDLTIDNSGYGALSAAEKNQTYFAYFSSVGGTGPELIDQTAYFVKYLIDAQGNVVTPQPNSIDVLNLIQNFEVGKTVNVTSLEGTTLFSTLLGTKTITDIGRIETILTTETGSGKMDYITTMSFSQGGTSLQTGFIPDYTFSTKKVNSSAITATSWTTMDYPYELSDPSSSYNNSTYTYAFSTNTYDYSTKVTFKASMFVNGLSPSEVLYMQIIKSTDNFVTSQSLDLTIATPGVNFSNNLNTPPIQSIITTDEGQVYRAQGGSATSAYLNYIQTVPQVFESGSRIRVRYKLESLSAFSPSLLVLGSAPNTLNTSFLATTNYSNALEVISPYWVPLNYPTSSNATQSLITSIGLTNVLNPQSNYVQIIPTSSLSLGFNNITFPSYLLPGDYIRFEYDKTKISKIYNISTYTILGVGVTQIDIKPPIPSGSITDHFTVFRINPNAGNQIILDVPKPSGTTGQTLTGFLKPQYMSEELESDFTTIVQKLAAEGLLT
jgi:hypothetical protein